MSKALLDGLRFTVLEFVDFAAAVDRSMLGDDATAEESVEAEAEREAVRVTEFRAIIEKLMDDAGFDLEPFVQFTTTLGMALEEIDPDAFESNDSEPPDNLLADDMPF